ncbi:F-box only protein 9-like [Pocillopora damicornis]|uniref:F-box only protein 9-like n=1 Tax=Pocillopora damicornis TaxID=46731 RepID=UPI000F558207|nr:F-box only protein 9-like [Pocillopora damicornis]
MVLVGSNDSEQLDLMRQLICSYKGCLRRGMEISMKATIYFYRQAVQLVPDIEFRIKDFTSYNLASASGDEEDDPNVSQESDDSPELADLANRFLSLSVTGFCQPLYETRMTHISAIPLELVMYIFKWVVSTELDMKSLEHLALVCKGFYACARDPDIWKLACQRYMHEHCSLLNGWENDAI